jgi:hypothetical protein
MGDEDGAEGVGSSRRKAIIHYDLKPGASQPAGSTLYPSQTLLSNSSLEMKSRHLAITN